MSSFLQSLLARSAFLKVSDTKGKVCGKESVPLVEQDQVREYLSNPDVHKSMGPDGVHTQVLRELVDLIVKPLNNH